MFAGYVDDARSLPHPRSVATGCDMGPVEAAVGIVTAPVRLVGKVLRTRGDECIVDETANERYHPEEYTGKAAHYPEVDAKDVKTPDQWVHRHPSMIRLTGRHPFNSEAPLPELLRYGFISPQNLHIVRNHGAVPTLDWETHKISVKGNVGKAFVISMPELEAMKSITFPCLVTCAGNR